MAKVKVNFQSKVFYPIVGCQEVAISLDPAVWDASRVTSGVPFVIATVENSGRFLGSANNPFAPRFENPRGEEDYQYTLVYDDAQLEDETPGNPYVISCSDIISLVDKTIADQFAAIQAAFDALP